MRGDRKIWRNGLVSKKVDMSKRGAPVDSQDFDVQNLVNVKQKGQHEISKNISERLISKKAFQNFQFHASAFKL